MAHETWPTPLRLAYLALPWLFGLFTLSMALAVARDELAGLRRAWRARRGGAATQREVPQTPPAA